MADPVKMPPSAPDARGVTADLNRLKASEELKARVKDAQEAAYKRKRKRGQLTTRDIASGPTGKLK